MKAYIFMVRYVTGNYALKKAPVHGNSSKCFKVYSIKQLYSHIRYISWYKPNTIIYRAVEKYCLAKDYLYSFAVEDFNILRPSDARQLKLNFNKL